MTAYIIRRFFILVPLLLVMSFVTFMFIQLAPGDYFAVLRMNPQISDETVARLQAQYHLDKPARWNHLPTNNAGVTDHRDH